MTSPPSAPDGYTPASPRALVAGDLIPYAGALVPASRLACDGSAVSRTAYAALFAAVGVFYGPGDGVTTFNVPPLPGYTIVT